MKSTLLVFAAALLVSAPDSRVFSADTNTPLKPIRGEVIINRTNSAWESQQVQEPRILPNPKDPARLVMFYSGVPATNRSLCFVGKAWALKPEPFNRHAEELQPQSVRDWQAGLGKNCRDPAAAWAC